MNITKIHNSILPTYDKSGYNNKNFSKNKIIFLLFKKKFFIKTL